MPLLEGIKTQVIVPFNFVLKFTNLLMLDGKKTKALLTLSKSLNLFKKCVENLSCDAQFIPPNTEKKIPHLITYIKLCIMSNQV